MDFKIASNRLRHCPTLGAIAKEAGVSEGLIRQARMDAGAPAYRNPPENWPQAIATLARTRAAELLDLAEKLEGQR